MAETLLWTYQDAVEWVLDAQNANEPNTGAPQRLARKAVAEAYRELVNLNQWSYLEGRYQFVTSAPYSTGTITYDHTGGASERLLTLASGTWPSWAAFGRVIIAGVHYTVATRESDTLLTLSPNSNPGDDVAAGTSYQIYRDTYPLPVNFHKMRLVRNQTDDDDIDPISPDEAFAQTSWLRTPGDPITYAISGDGEYYGSLGITLSPPPSSAAQYEIWYERSHRPLKTYLYSTGTATVTGGATTVTVNGGVLNSNRHLGAIIRFSADGTTLPTSDYGTIDGADNPYVAQRVITAIASTTSCTIDAAASTSTLTTVKYTISDPLGIESQSTLTALLMLAEAIYARMTGNKTADDKYARALQQVKVAAAADYRTLEVTSAGGGGSGMGVVPSLADWASE